MNRSIVVTDVCTAPPRQVPCRRSEVGTPLPASLLLGDALVSDRVRHSAAARVHRHLVAVSGDRNGSVLIGPPDGNIMAPEPAQSLRGGVAIGVPPDRDDCGFRPE